MTANEDKLANMLKLSQHANDMLQGAVNRRITEALEELTTAKQVSTNSVAIERIDYVMGRLKGLINNV